MAVGLTSQLFQRVTATDIFCQRNKFRSSEMRSSLPLPSTSFPSVADVWSCDALLANPATSLVVPAIGIIVFALWGFLPLMRDIRNRFDHGGNWKKSPTYLISSSYLQPLLLWTGATLICRGLDPVVLPSAASQAVKTRLITFVRSLSTVLAVAYILTRCTCYILRKTAVVFCKL
ncbi:Mechanosensitive ion channel protein 3 chloroplastic [Zea mays]|uniref:Mechanosensitive ion channel protein 3 chloroplastic n=1 Tax=Zea mays TaxID=4577 RepID=A0A1D6K695_MAIZE|nr:Mechanosensitive ion channel protein 3 chloroplastic [Zea mays]